MEQANQAQRDRAARIVCSMVWDARMTEKSVADYFGINIIYISPLWRTSWYCPSEIIHKVLANTVKLAA